MNAPNEIRAMLVESATRLFADHVDAGMLEAAKRDGWSAALWAVMESAELPRVSVPEEAGGAGGTLSDLAAVLRVAGRYAAPVPFVETALLGNWLLAGAGLELPRGPLAVLPGAPLSGQRSGDGWAVSGKRGRVPWARIAARLVGLAACAGASCSAGVRRCHGSHATPASGAGPCSPHGGGARARPGAFNRLRPATRAVRPPDRPIPGYSAGTGARRGRSRRSRCSRALGGRSGGTTGRSAVRGRGSEDTHGGCRA
ncbi:MAG: acyl-CoA dehydrogenase family protein [Betaproteobacteria bacterium]|nr:acyl-CoA dehydrogenase family protein [Betaproteobacteria bacterium]